MLEIKAPNPIGKTKTRTLFLAGSIEMDTAHEWQDDVKELLADENIILLNPRRAKWDNSWKQAKDNNQFREQVEWELDAQERADQIFMYFDPETKSPISLLELGLFARSGKLVVCCPEGFYRKGNVDIVCEKYGVPHIEKLADLKAFIAHAEKS